MALPGHGVASAHRKSVACKHVDHVTTARLGTHRALLQHTNVKATFAHVLVRTS